MTRVCITGGGGYLGSVLVGELLKHGYKVDVVDRLNYGDSGVKPYVGVDGYRFYEYDIRDLYHVRKLVSEADYIIHLAALVGEALCDKYPGETWGVNVEGTRGLSEVAEENHTPLILASTCSNYGVTSGLAVERTPVNPQGLYAESKVEAERAVCGLDSSIILRFATLFGVSPRMRLDLMLNEWTTQMLDDGFIKIYQPDAYRPIFNVGDAAKTIRLFLDNFDESLHGIYNVGYNKYNFTKREIALIIQREVGGRIDYVERGDPRSYRVSFDKITEKGFISNPITPRIGVKLVEKFLSTATDTSQCYNMRGYIDKHI